MAHSLDSRDFVTRLDPKGMLPLTEAFGDQCRRALEIARGVAMPTLSNRPNLVMLTGLGGSAVGGDFVKALFDAHGTTPFVVNRDYHLPHYVGLGDVVFATSYSGNTEETLSAYADAKKAGAKIIVVTSGGKLAQLAQENGDTLIQIPGGQPPRTALGFMLIPVLVACEGLKLLPAQDYMAAFDALDRLVKEDVGVDIPFESNQAKQLAAELQGAVSVIYGLGSWQAIVANRWKGQINENSKNMTFANAFPELNHNEILGWVKADAQGVAKWVGVLLEDGSESAKMKTRAKVTEGLIGSTAKFHHVQAKGDALLERMLTLVLFGDFVSLYLAALNEVDPENIDAINVLKTELSKVD